MPNQRMTEILTYVFRYLAYFPHSFWCGVECSKFREYLWAMEEQGVREGLEARLQGKVKPLSQVQEELGMEEQDAKH
jgi:hypothetical protein